jgi:hypothetical protein
MQQWFASVEWWYSWTGDPDDKEHNHVVAPAVQVNTLVQPPRLVTSILKTETVTTTSSLLRREAIETVGGFDDSFSWFVRGPSLLRKAFYPTARVRGGQMLVSVRKHPDSSCAVAVQTGNYRDARLTFCSGLKVFGRTKHRGYRGLERPSPRTLEMSAP